MIIIRMTTDIISISMKLWKHPVRAESRDRGNINSWTGHACLSALPLPNVSFWGLRNFNHLGVFFILLYENAPRISEITEEVLGIGKKTFSKFGLLQSKILLEVSWINLLGAFFSAWREAEWHLSDKTCATIATVLQTYNVRHKAFFSSN